MLSVAALLAAPLMATAGAQLPHAATDSVALLPAIQLSAASTGASVAVIDSADIASSGARTLSELLLARVPGLSVRHRGGTEADGFEISARGMGPVDAQPGGVLAPMLVIDGIMADAHQGLRVPGTTIRISRLDDLTPAEVQRIEVLRGPAASALYGVGAAAGVIVVTTRRGGTGPLTLDVNASAGLTQMAADFPSNYQLTNGTPQQPCNPRRSPTQTVASCAPMTLYSWNPLEQASPFRLGHSVTGGTTLSGITRGFQLFGGLSAEQANGVTDNDRQSRVGMHGSVERSLPGQLKVSAQGSYLRRDATVSASAFTSDDVIGRGMLGSAYDDSLHGYRPVDPTFSMIGRKAPSLSRVVGALRLGWDPLDWLNVDALAGQDRARESASYYTKMSEPYGSTDWYSFIGDRWTSGTMHVGAMSRFAAGANILLKTYLAYDDVRIHDRTTDSSGTNAGASSFEWTRRRRHAQEATVRQHLSWGDIFHVNAGARVSVGRGVVPPFGAEAARNVDASLRLPSPHAGVQLRLRGAAGLVPLLPPGVVHLIDAGPGGFTYSPLRSRQGEREGGIDAAFGSRARIELTWFRARTRDAEFGTFPPSPTSYPYELPLLADVTNAGVEAVASAQWRQGDRFGWHSTVTAATLHSKVTHASGPSSLSLNSRLAAGYPLQGYWTYSYDWRDANGDGLIATSEVIPNTSVYVGPSKPTLEVGMHNAVTLPRGISVAALFDYRHGQYRDNQSESARCRTGLRVCRGIQDPTLPLTEQARWSAIANGLARDIVPASYLRLREVVVQWAPKTQRKGMHRLAVRVVGQNLLMWSQYDGVDPEVGATAFGAWEAPSESFQSPLPRRVRVEVKLGIR